MIFVIWRRRSLPKDARDEHPEAIADERAAATARPRPASRDSSSQPLRSLRLELADTTAGRSSVESSTDGSESAGTAFATQTVGGLTITLLHPHGQLRAAANEAFIEFRNADGELVDAGEVKLNLGMNMTGMVMHSGATVKRTDTPGRYRVEITPDMGGDWTASLSFDGPQGPSETSFTVNVKP